MKKIFLMIMLMLICINNVQAKDTESFYYNDEKIEDMWITRSNSTFTRSANPYLIKRQSDNAYVYCVEPFSLVQNGTPYTKDNDYTKYGISKEQMKRISLIMHYGFGYNNHNDKKWYGITQYMIWKTIDTKNTFYFSKVKDGAKEDLYTNEINEIESLISNYNKEPDYLKEYVVSTNDTLSIESNIDLSLYDINSDIEYDLVDNTFKFQNLKVGEYKVKLISKNNRFKNDVMLYYSNDSQNVIIPGINIDNIKEYEFTIKVKEGEVNIDKYSSTTKEKLKDATYGIYEGDKLITKVVTDSNGNGKINLPFGTYTLKELVAPPGYKLDSNIYTFTIDENNLSINLELVDDKIVINVPDTGLKRNNTSFMFIFLGLLGLFYEKKKCNMH